MSGQPAAARSDYNAEAPRASALLKPVTSFPSSRAYWQSPPQGITTHCAVTRHLPKPTRRSYSAGRARRCRRAARCCAALAQPARAVRTLWPHFSCRAKSGGQQRPMPLPQKRFRVLPKTGSRSVKNSRSRFQRAFRKATVCLVSATVDIYRSIFGIPTEARHPPMAKNTVTVWPHQLSHGSLSHPSARICGIFSNFGRAGSVGIHIGRRLLISWSLNQL